MARDSLDPSPADLSGAPVSDTQPDIRPVTQIEPILAQMSEALVMVDQQWRILYQNPAAERLNAHEPLNGQSAGMGGIGKLYWEHWSVADPAPYEQAMALRQAAQFEQQFEQQFEPGASQKGTNSARWLAVRIYPSEAGLNLFLEEVSERKQAEIAAADTHRRFQAVFNQQFQFMAILTPQGKVIEANEACFRGTGVRREQAIGRYFWETPWWNQLPELKNLWHRSLAVVSGCDPVTGEGEYRLADGSIRYADYAITGLRDEQNQVISVIVEGRDITDRRLAEAALLSSQERLALASQAAQFGTFEWNIQTGEVIWSAEEEALYGLPPGSFGGRYDAWRERVHPADYEQAAATIQQAIADGSDWEHQFRIIRPDGVQRWIHARARVFCNPQGQPERMIGVNEDVTERQQAAANLAESEARYRTMANAVPLMLWVSRPNGEPEFFNDQLYSYVGSSSLGSSLGDQAPQPQPTDWTQHVLAEDLPQLVAIRNQALQSKSAYEVEVRIRRADGVYRWHLVRAVPQKQAETVLAWFGTATDIHDTKQLALDNAQLYQQAQEANRIKDEFLAVLSHELRSPLNPILGWTRLLQTRQFDAAATQRALEIIERNAKLQTQLIEDLLDISRILRGKMSLTFAPVNLVSTVEAALETVRLSAEQKRIDLRFLPPGASSTSSTSKSGESLYVSGDTGRLQQVIWNLLSNAIKFTPEGGRVELQLRQATNPQGTNPQGTNPQGTNPQGNWAQITVTDSGKGIHPDFLPYVFESFRQEDSKTTRSFGGLGLGLAIVRHLSELHGGTVQAASAGEGQGTCFTLRLPLIERAEPDHGTAALPSTDALPLAGLRILVVDDEADARALSLTLLEQAGAAVRVANSAATALALLNAELPDLLISDIGMPEMDGYMLIRQVRQRQNEAALPAIALTAYARSEDQAQVLKAGFQAHLTKPINGSELIDWIIQLCRTCR